MKKRNIIILLIMSFFIITGCDDSSSSDTKPTSQFNGCFSGHTGGYDVSFCFNGSTVTYTNFGKTKTYYTDLVGKQMWIVDEYDKNMFVCTISTEDSNKMKCEAEQNETGKGYATYNLEKK